jgi:hypothetical protein
MKGRRKREEEGGRGMRKRKGLEEGEEVCGRRNVEEEWGRGRGRRKGRRYAG